MGSRLQEVLRRLCVEIGWSYAVFWKPTRYSNPMQFVWGDGNCKRESGVPAISGFDAMDLLLKEKMVLRNSRKGNATELGCRSEDRLTTLVNKLMVPQVHVVGDGIVGQAALTGNHRWILRENPNDYECTSKALTEMKQQFWAGIQTIAIIPLLPHGVVQLGSTKMVMEDVGFINHVRRMFAELASESGAPLPGVMLNDSTQKSSVHNSHGVPISIAADTNSTQAYGKFSGDLTQQTIHPDFPSNICFDMQLENEQLKSLLGVHSSGVGSSNSMLPNRASSTINNDAFFGTSDSCHRSLMHIEKQLLSLPSDASMEEPRAHNEFDRSVKSVALSVDMQPSNITTSVRRKFQTMSIAENPNQEGSSFQAVDVTLAESTQRFSCLQSMHGNLLVSSNENAIQGNDLFDEKKLSVSSQFTEGNDLFDVLGLEYEKNRSLDSLPVVSSLQSEDLSACLTERGASSLIGAMNEDVTCSGLLSDAEPDQLLDAIVARINSGGKHKLDDGVPCRSSMVKIDGLLFSPSSSGCLSGSSPKLMLGEHADASRIVKSESMDKSEGCSQRDLGYKSRIGLWAGNSQIAASDSISAGHCKGADEVGKSGRKRSRHGENPRPRPKDRQMIQDRIKELREIVPNGAKCSIDALLEKTVKHMLFLQSVAKHADKLKEIVEPKIISKEEGVLLKDNFEGGATRAFEVGTQSMTCPIIVEDLSLPRQMLIEMLCKERGLFLEIADQIRVLGLTILKGVMEVRRDKVWARFAVEANRDVTRMEIFLSLVHLLEPSAGSSILPKGVENISLQHSNFNPYIPATGFAGCLH